MFSKSSKFENKNSENAKIFQRTKGIKNMEKILNITEVFDVTITDDEENYYDISAVSF